MDQVFLSSFLPRFRRTVGALTLGCIFAASFLANAEAQTFVKKAAPDSVFRTFAVPAGFTGRYATIYFLSKGNMSQNVSLSVSAPLGANLTAKSSIASSKLSAQLASSKRWNSIKLKSYTNGEASSYTFVNRDPVSTTSPAPLLPEPLLLSSCSILTAAELENFIRAYAEAVGHPVTAADLCGPDYTPRPSTGSGSGGGSTGDSGGAPFVPSAGPGSAVFSGGFLLHKDTCGASSKGKYVVRLDVRLDKVDPALRQAGFDIGVYVSARDYGGEKASTLKPTSDGRFAPQPLLLMSSIGSNEKLTVVTWKDGKINGSKSSAIADYVSYRSLLLSRTPAGKFLNGKKGTVEVSNGTEVYSVCFELKRKRQSVHGYPK